MLIVGEVCPNRAKKRGARRNKHGVGEIIQKSIESLFRVRDFRRDERLRFLHEFSGFESISDRHIFFYDFE